MIIVKVCLRNNPLKFYLKKNQEMISHKCALVIVNIGLTILKKNRHFFVKNKICIFAANLDDLFT